MPSAAKSLEPEFAENTGVPSCTRFRTGSASTSVRGSVVTTPCVLTDAAWLSSFAIEATSSVTIGA